MWPDYGCFVHLKRAAAIGFAIIKVVYQWIVSLLLCIIAGKMVC
jgi:hypothetical protein